MIIHSSSFWQWQEDILIREMSLALLKSRQGHCTEKKTFSFHSKHFDNFKILNSAHTFVYTLNDISLTLMRASFRRKMKLLNLTK